MKEIGENDNKKGGSEGERHTVEVLQRDYWKPWPCLHVALEKEYMDGSG